MGRKYINHSTENSLNIFLLLFELRYWCRNVHNYSMFNFELILFETKAKSYHPLSDKKVRNSCLCIHSTACTKPIQKIMWFFRHSSLSEFLLVFGWLIDFTRCIFNLNKNRCECVRIFIQSRRTNIWRAPTELIITNHSCSRECVWVILYTTAYINRFYQHTLTHTSKVFNLLWFSFCATITFPYGCLLSVSFYFWFQLSFIRSFETILLLSISSHNFTYMRIEWILSFTWNWKNICDCVEVSTLNACWLRIMCSHDLNMYT